MNNVSTLTQNNSNTLIPDFFYKMIFFQYQLIRDFFCTVKCVLLVLASKSCETEICRCG